MENEFTEAERRAMEKFDQVINYISDKLPDVTPYIEEFINSKEWEIVNQAAIEALSKIKRVE